MTKLSFSGYKNGDIVVYPLDSEVHATIFDGEDQLKTFITQHSFPIVSEFSPVSFRRHVDKKFTIIGVDFISDEEKKENLISILENVSVNKSEFGFLYGDAAKLKRGIEGAGASGNVFPSILAINPETNAQFAFDEELEFAVENIAIWLDGLLDGTTKTFRKSQPIPSENNKLVKLLVAKNFHEIDGKDSIVMYYAPWCPHFQELEPIYENVAAFFQRETIIFAKMDPTANYHEEEINEIPTLIYYSSRGWKKQYSGDRTYNDLITFIEDNQSSHQHEEL